MLATRTAPTLAELPDDTFRDFVRCNVARGDASPATVEAYVREARAFRSYLAAEGIPLPAVTPAAVRAWRQRLVEANYSPATIGTKLAALRRLLDGAVEAGILAANPAKGVQGPRDKRLTGAAAARTLDLDELRRLIASVSGDDATAERDRAMLGLLVGHGLRTVEVARLRLADVDLEKRELVAHGKIRDRLVFLRADVADRLRTVVERRKIDGAHANDAVFVSHGRAECNGHGKALSRRGVRFIVDRTFATAGLVPVAAGKNGRSLHRAALGKRAARAAGAKLPTTHGLRASYVTLAIEAGAPIEHVAAAVGHADIRTTARYLELKRQREHNPALRVAVEF